MKFEINSEYRNRNLYPDCGNFIIETTQYQNTKFSAVDPVCNSMPIFSWVPNLNYSGTIQNNSNINSEFTELFISFASVQLQASVIDFLAGCILNSATLNLKILKSKQLGPLLFQIICPKVSQIILAQAVTVLDYTTFNPVNIRVPTNIDFGQYNILYNETRNDFVKIINCNLKNRNLKVENKDLSLWSTSDNLNIRNDIPLGTVTILGSTSTVLTLSASLSNENVFNWVRLRLPSYATSVFTDSWSRRIISINANQITISPALTILPAIASVIEIMNFSYDNAYPLQNVNNDLTIPYYANLECLTIPNCEIYNGTLYSIPHLLIEFNNSNSSVSQKHLINSNNPFVTESVWIAKLDPISIGNPELRFTTTDTNQNYQKLIFNINEPLLIKIKLPNGKLFKPLVQDTVMPSAPIQDLNLKLIFDFQSIDKNYYERN